MGIITGYVCLVFMLFLMLKFPARKFRWNTVNAFLMKVHKYAAALFLAVGAVHFVLVFSVLRSRMRIIPVSGILAVLAGLLLVIFCHVMKDRKKELLFHRLLSVLIVGMTVIHMVFYRIDFSRYQMKVQSITIEEADLTGIPDGEYVGESDVGYIYARVRITVKDGEITKAELLEHRNERGGKAEAVLDGIVSGQKIDADTVSGATNSSRVIKKACENALRGN